MILSAALRRPVMLPARLTVNVRKLPTAVPPVYPTSEAPAIPVKNYLFAAMSVPLRQIVKMPEMVVLNAYLQAAELPQAAVVL